MSKDIFLFDMDGTITPARKPMTEEMADAFEDILLAGHDIGIITGSDMDFLTEQCEPLFRRNMHSVIHFWPCNGSKYYKWNDASKDLELLRSIDMREELGQEIFNDLIVSINRVHWETLKTMEALELPMTGRFITFRKSSINYCPIGRDFNDEGRRLFESHPKNREVRTKILRRIKQYFVLATNGHGHNLIDFALGGKVSIDIFLNNGGKEQVLDLTKKRAWFVGDNVGEFGNDTMIYRKLSKKKRSFETSGPEQTIEIISKILERIRTGG
jgi:phosphomannomutase